MTQRKNIDKISNCIARLDEKVLENIITRLRNNEGVSPQTDAEKNCFTLLKHLDSVAAHVKGSMIGRKHMRNEIWSLIIKLGAPTWFVTLSPADHVHPISLYFAGGDICFKPDLKTEKERISLMARNPVVAARFFNFIIEAFLKHVLAVGSGKEGFYSETEAYYGTVEQQG